MASRNLQITYTGDARGLMKTLGEIDSAHATLGSRLTSAGKSMSSAGATMTRNFTLPVVAGFAVAITQATEFAQVQGQTQAALKSTGGAAGVTAEHIATLSNKIGELTAQDGEAVQSMENILLTFPSVANEVGKGNAIFDRASIAIANMSARLGTDLKGSAIQVGKALADPIKGLTALTRVGVVFTEQQRTMITKMVEAGDVLGAQKVILGELNKEFGGSAKAAGAAASPFTKLKLVFLDLAQSVGTVLLPMAEQAGAFVGALAAKFQTLSPEVQKVIVVVGLVVAAIGPLLFVVGKLTSAFGLVLTAAQGLFTFLLANPFVALAAAVIAIGILIVTHFREIKEFVLSIWNKIKEVTHTVWSAIPGPIKSAIAVILGIIKAAFGIIKSVFQMGWEAVKLVTKAAWEVIKTVVIHPLEFVWDKIKGFFQKVKPAWDTFWGALGDIVGGAWDVIVAASSAAMNVIKAILNGVIMAINAVIHGFNLLPGHGDVPTIPHLASGTSNFAGGLALVGERGPEVVGLPRGATVTPLNRMGTTIVVNVAGSVIAERDLMEKIRTAAQRGAARNAQVTGF